MNKIELARAPDTHPEILDELSRDDNWNVRWEVACNPNTPEQSLERLLYNWHENRGIYHRVLRNPNTPLQALERLSNTTNSGVGNRILENPGTPKYIKNYILYQRYLKCYEQN